MFIVVAVEVLFKKRNSSLLRIQCIINFKPCQSITKLNAVIDFLSVSAIDVFLTSDIFPYAIQNMCPFYRLHRFCVQP